MGKIKYRSLTGMALAAMTLLSLAPGASAIADSSQSDLVPVNIPTDNSASISIKGAANTMQGHAFKAVRIGTYLNAQATQAPDSKIASVSVGTDPAAKKAAEDALGKMTSVDSQYKGNPMGQVASKWLGYSTPDNPANEDRVSNNRNYGWGGTNSSPVEGKLRTFVQTLDEDKDFRNLVDKTAMLPPSEPQCSDNAAKKCVTTLSNLQDGIYIVIDVTSSLVKSGGTNAIPMMVSTAVGTYNHMQSASAPTLGEIDMKNANTSISIDWNDRHNNSSLTIGETADYTIRGVTPMTTGFSHYTYAMTVNLSRGQTYYGEDPDSPGTSPTVLIGGKQVSEHSASKPDGIYDYSKTVNADGSTTLVFDFTDRILTFAPNRTIQVMFSAEINNDAAASGSVTTDLNLKYSKDARNPEVIGSIDAQRIQIGLGGLQMLTSMRTHSGSTPSTASFTMTRDFDGKPLSFEKLGDGTYQVTSEKSGHPTTTIASADGIDAQSGGLTKGNLKVSGLGYGTYTVTQTADENRNGLMNKVNPSFKVTLAPKQLAGGSTDPTDVTYTNTTDAWHLVPANSFENGVLPVQDASSVSQLPLDGAAGWFAIGAVVVLLVMVMAALTVLKRRASAR